jgi:hypothetical protein
MDRIKFYEFLTVEYRGPRTGKPLQHRSALDACSLCLSVEALFDKDMDQLVRDGQTWQQTVETIRRDILEREKKGQAARFTKNMISAVNHYFNFFLHQHRNDLR